MLMLSLLFSTIWVVCSGNIVNKDSLVKFCSDDYLPAKLK